MVGRDLPRYAVSLTAGGRPGRAWVVVDRNDQQGGKGARRVSFHRTFRAAMATVKRLNEEERR